MVQIQITDVTPAQIVFSEKISGFIHFFLSQGRICACSHKASSLFAQRCTFDDEREGRLGFADGVLGCEGVVAGVAPLGGEDGQAPVGRLRLGVYVLVGAKRCVPETPTGSRRRYARDGRLDQHFGASLHLHGVFELVVVCDRWFGCKNECRMRDGQGWL